MKKFAFALIFSTLIACGSRGRKDDDLPPNTTDPIIGSWEFFYDNGFNTTTNFFEDGTGNEIRDTTAYSFTWATRTGDFNAWEQVHDIYPGENEIMFVEGNKIMFIIFYRTDDFDSAAFEAFDGTYPLSEGTARKK